MSKFFADLTGPVTPKEAHEALIRFTNSHFRKHDAEHARASIPANPRRADDIRLSAFIEHVEQLVEAADGVLSEQLERDAFTKLRAAVANLKEVR